MILVSLSKENNTSQKFVILDLSDTEMTRVDYKNL